MCVCGGEGDISNTVNLKQEFFAALNYYYNTSENSSTLKIFTLVTSILLVQHAVYIQHAIYI